MHYNYKFFSLYETEKKCDKSLALQLLKYLVFLLNTDSRVEKNFKF